MNKPVKTSIIYYAMQEDKKLLTLSEYASIKGISSKTAYNWYKSGKIKETIIYKGKQPLIQII
jgi:hypothetical protein